MPDPDPVHASLEEAYLLLGSALSTSRAAQARLPTRQSMDTRTAELDGAARDVLGAVAGLRRALGAMPQDDPARTSLHARVETLERGRAEAHARHLDGLAAARRDIAAALQARGLPVPDDLPPATGLARLVESLGLPPSAGPLLLGGAAFTLCSLVVAVLRTWGG